MSKLKGMSKNLRQVITILLLAVLLLSATTGFAFASSGSSDESVNRTNKSTTYELSDANKNNKQGTYPSVIGQDPGKDYLLEVMTNNINTLTIDSVIIKYYTTPEQSDASVATQVLSPHRVEYDDTIISSILNPQMMCHGSSLWATTGSQFATFYGMVGTEDVAGASYYEVDGYTVARHLNKYSDWAQEIVENGSKDTNFEFENAVEKYSNPENSFAPYSTTYMRFRFEYPMTGIKSVSFVCSKGDGTGGSGEWMVNGWTLFALKNDDTSDKAMASLSATNYAFVSNQLGLVFDGTVVCQSTTLTNEKLARNGYGVDGCGVITYYDKDELKPYFTDSTTETIKDSKDAKAQNYNTAISYGMQKSTLCFENVNNGIEVKSTDRKIFNFEINIADQYGAGIEGFCKSPTTVDGQKSMYLEDCLMANIQYVDKAGIKKYVSVPVVSNALLEYCLPTAESIIPDSGIGELVDVRRILEGEYLEFAQQGDSIYFSVEFPDIDSVQSVSLEYYSDNGLLSKDQLQIASVAVYDNGGNNAYVDRDAYKHLSDVAIGIERPDNWSMQFVSTDNKVRVLDNDTKAVTYKLRDCRRDDESAKGLPNTISYDDTYLVRITTNNYKDSSSRAELYASFSYIDGSGNHCTSMEYAVRDLIMDYTGYQAGVLTGDPHPVDDNLSLPTRYDASYDYGMNQGNELNMLITIRNLKEFEGINLRIEGGNRGRDVWQMQGLEIYSMYGLGKRICKQLDTTEYTSFYGDDGSDVYRFTTDRTYERVLMAGQELYVNKDAVLLLQLGEKKTFLLENSQVSGQEILRPTVTGYQVSYHQLVGEDQGYTTAVKTYVVNVKVADNQDIDGTDNAGSNNLFYFQLVFENGKSAYVLANKQLNADGFRSGMTESFNIQCNKDMGDVKSISIIPDDISPNSQPLDKLKIDTITVIKENNDAPNKKFVAYDVGWISTDYRDLSEATEKEGRTESMLAYNAPISYSGYTIDLEVGLTWGEVQNGDGAQYQGDLVMELEYYDTKGAWKSMTGIQVVQGMYEYRGQTARFNETTKRYVSDSETMFKSGTTDRFILPVDDLATATAIHFTFYPTAELSDNTYIKLDGITVKILQSDQGSIAQKGENGEWYKSYASDKQPILYAEYAKSEGRQDSEGGREFKVSNGTKLKNIYLDCDYGIPSYDTITSFESIPSRVPASNNDMLNIYLNLAPGTPAPSTGNYRLQTYIKYSAASLNQVAKTYVEDYNEQVVTNANGKQVVQLSAREVSARCMSTLNTIQLFCDDIDRNLSVESGVIQRVRDGVIIDTYHIQFMGNRFSKIGGAETNSFVSARGEDSKQVFKIVLGETARTTLAAGGFDESDAGRDIGVAIEYKTSNFGGGVYSSPYSYATDFGYKEIYTGAELEFEFDEYDVKEVTGIKIYCSGGIESSIDSVNGFSGANLVCYSIDESGNQTITDWYSIAAQEPLDKSVRKFEPVRGASDVDTLKLATFTFTTPVGGQIDSGGTVPIRLQLSYKQKSGTATARISDIRDYVTSYTGEAPFAENSKTTVSLMLPGVEQLVSMEVEPHDDDDSSITAFSLDRVSYKCEGISDTTTHTILVNDTIYENDPMTISVSMVKLGVISTYDGKNYESVNGGSAFAVNGGKEIKFQTTVSGASSGYLLSTYLIDNGSKTQIGSHGSQDGEFIYPDKLVNNTDHDIIYRFVIVASDNIAAQAVVEVTVHPEVAEITTGPAITTN